MSAQPFRSSTFAASGWARRLRPVAVAVSLALVAETAAAAEATAAQPATAVAPAAPSAPAAVPAPKAALEAPDAASAQLTAQLRQEPVEVLDARTETTTVRRLAMGRRRVQAEVGVEVRDHFRIAEEQALAEADS